MSQISGLRFANPPYGLKVDPMAAISPATWAFTERHQRILESKECLAGLHNGEACAGKIVRAHIIPRSQLLQVAMHGSVHAVPTRLSAVMQMQRSAFEARDIGARAFSVLNCFCTWHDKSLFAPLEDAPLTFSSGQRALLHYRAIAAEAYQRRNQEEAAVSEARKYESNDPRRDRFYTIFQISSTAAEQAEDALKETEGIIEKRQYRRIHSLVVRFNAHPVFLSVGAFRPRYDVNGGIIQDLMLDGVYLAAHILIADGKQALVFTWLNGRRPAEQFARSFAARPKEHLTTLGIQMAFEHAEHTCMKREWWLGLHGRKRHPLLKRVQNANSLGYVRPKNYLAVRSILDDWGVTGIDFLS